MLALSFDYGQRHSVELVHANSVARWYGVEWKIISLRSVADLISSANSALVNPDVPVPEGHYAAESMKQTIVPNRNAMMLSIAFAVAIAKGAQLVGAAMHAGDHAIYPDCRPQFVERFRMMEWESQGYYGVDLWTPFINKTKTQIVKEAASNEVPLAMTWSCYKGGVLHCGKCGTCVERKEAFRDAGVTDPTMYESDIEIEATKGLGHAPS